MSKTKKPLRARKTKKIKCPKTVTGLTPMQSSDTLAFMSAFGRMGGRQGNPKAYNRTAQKNTDRKDSF